MQENSSLSDTFGSAQGCRLSLSHLLLTGGVSSAEGNSFQTFSTWQYCNNPLKLCWEISPSFQVLLTALFGAIIHALSLHRQQIQQHRFKGLIQIYLALHYTHA